MTLPVAVRSRGRPWGRYAWFGAIGMLITVASAYIAILSRPVSLSGQAFEFPSTHDSRDGLLSKGAVDIAARPMGPRLADDVVQWTATRSGRTEIWAARSSGTGVHRLVPTEDAGGQVLSHDRRTIAYVHDSVAYLSGTDGTGQRPLFTTHPSSCAIAGRPAFDGDDAALAVLCAGGPNRRDLYVADLDGSLHTSKPLVSGYIGDASFGVGGQIVFWQACHDDQRIARLAMIAATATPGTAPTALTGCIGANDPSFSPDGRSVAFTVWTGRDANVYVESLTSKMPRRLTSSRLPDQDPSWSPDGTRIAYKHGPSRNADIWLLTVADATTRALTHDAVPDTVPSWYTR